MSGQVSRGLPGDYESDERAENLTEALVNVTMEWVLRTAPRQVIPVETAKLAQQANNHSG